jgi:hypothetical protein
MDSPGCYWTLFSGMVDPLWRSIHHRHRLAQEPSHYLAWLKHFADQAAV